MFQIIKPQKSFKSTNKTPQPQFLLHLNVRINLLQRQKKYSLVSILLFLNENKK